MIFHVYSNHLLNQAMQDFEIQSWIHPSSISWIFAVTISDKEAIHYKEKKMEHSELPVGVKGWSRLKPSGSYCWMSWIEMIFITLFPLTWFQELRIPLLFHGEGRRLKHNRVIFCCYLLSLCSLPNWSC